MFLTILVNRQQIITTLSSHFKSSYMFVFKCHSAFFLVSKYYPSCTVLIKYIPYVGVNEVQVHNLSLHTNSYQWISIGYTGQLVYTNGQSLNASNLIGFYGQHWKINSGSGKHFWKNTSCKAIKKVISLSAISYIVIPSCQSLPCSLEQNFEHLTCH